MIPCDTEHVIVTRSLLEDGKSDGGAWSAKQLELLGVAWPPTSGWPKRLIGSRVKSSQVEEFLRLRNAHISPKKKPKAKKASKARGTDCAPVEAPQLWEKCRSTTFVEVSSRHEILCEAALRTIYPMRVLFTREQMLDAGYFIKRIGYDKTCQLADWAARKSSIKDGRYGKWRYLCRRHIADAMEM